jgi:hypothetical protein
MEVLCFSLTVTNVKQILTSELAGTAILVFAITAGSILLAQGDQRGQEGRQEKQRQEQKPQGVRGRGDQRAERQQQRREEQQSSGQRPREQPQRPEAQPQRPQAQATQQPGERGRPQLQPQQRSQEDRGNQARRQRPQPNQAIQPRSGYDSTPRSPQQVRTWQQQRGWQRRGAWQGPNSWQQGRATNWQQQHRTWQQRGGYGGYYIPADRFSLTFGDRRWFRLNSRPMIIGGYPRFDYGGYSFMLVDPWPEYWSDDWYATDDVYVDYRDDGYYLFNRRDPQFGIALSVVF